MFATIAAKLKGIMKGSSLKPCKEGAEFTALCCPRNPRKDAHLEVSCKLKEGVVTILRVSGFPSKLCELLPVFNSNIFQGSSGTSTSGRCSSVISWAGSALFPRALTLRSPGPAGFTGSHSLVTVSSSRISANMRTGIRIVADKLKTGALKPSIPKLSGKAIARAATKPMRNTNLASVETLSWWTG